MGFVISRANIGRQAAGTDTGVIPCPLVSACVREENRKGRQTEPQGKRQGRERRAANHAEQRELKPYAFFWQRKRLPGLMNDSFRLVGLTFLYLASRRSQLAL